eukprot:TRINITY_DN1845_c0_g1_i2.p1 TRINITY_DN1845_c0_g1~~TRINITY_DN1845_c0_g1_i2.p1  ORF type:complete len:130 (+),score=2.31 TRINITY_DN1845_c0_g1_i2:66-455(+)
MLLLHYPLYAPLDFPLVNESLSNRVPQPQGLFRQCQTLRRPIPMGGPNDDADSGGVQQQLGKASALPPAPRRNTKIVDSKFHDYVLLTQKSEVVQMPLPLFPHPIFVNIFMKPYIMSLKVQMGGSGKIQ